MVSSDLRLSRKERWIFSKVVKISDFRILSDCIEKYKHALSKSNSSWDNSHCVRLAIVSLAVNIGKLQILVSEGVFLCWVYNSFCGDWLLCNIIGIFRMFKSVEESCLDKKFSDILRSFKTCWSSLLRLLMALRRSFLRIDEAFLFETFGSLKIRNFFYPNKNPIYFNQVYNCQSNPIKSENPKSLLPLKRFIILLLTTLNPSKQKVR